MEFIDGHMEFIVDGEIPRELDRVIRRADKLDGISATYVRIPRVGGYLTPRYGIRVDMHGDYDLAGWAALLRDLNGFIFEGKEIPE